MEEGYNSLPASHTIGSVPAAISEEIQVPKTNLQIFPPGNNASGYQAPGTPYGEDAQTTNKWNGYFNIASYQPYFNVDTDIVFDRLVGAMYPMYGFYTKIDANPDLYGPIWISTTLIFMLSALGNCAAYLMHDGIKSNTTWNFDVNYVNWAACAIYGYVLAVPTAFYFLLRYFGSNAELIKLWCIWGYSLFIFIPTTVFLVIPVEFIRWIITLIVGSASAFFVALNLKPFTEGQHDLFLWIIGASALQFALAVFIKVFFFA